MKRKLLLTIFLGFSLSFSAQTISIIGTTSPTGNWVSDTDMITTDNINYTLSNVVLTSAGDPTTTGLKFRQDHDWTINWGSSSFPTGIGFQNGANILTQSGTYNISFNRNTGAYSFVNTNYPTISLVGNALLGWTGTSIDVPMSTTDGVIYTLNGYSFTQGEAKFRQDNSWTTNWGTNNQSNCFPNAIAVFNASFNIVIPAGNYNVTFNKNTLEYSFTQVLGVEHFISKKLTVFPNPSTGLWSFDSNQSIKNISIFDVLGNTIFYVESDIEQVSIDLSFCKSGIYLAKIATQNDIQTFKLIKE
jgi:hypothetical protein